MKKLQQTVYSITYHGQDIQFTDVYHDASDCFYDGLKYAKEMNPEATITHIEIDGASNDRNVFEVPQDELKALLENGQSLFIDCNSGRTVELIKNIIK